MNKTYRHPAAFCVYSLPIALSTVTGLSFSTPAYAEATTSPGSVELQSTNYAIPSQSIFIATDGNDKNPGTINRPVRSIAKAIDEAPEGSTLILREGVYRGSMGTIWKRLTLQPYPGEKVWIKGSQIVRNWEKIANGWRTYNLQSKFCQDCYDPENVIPANPAAALPDQVFIDGQPLQQVLLTEDLTKDSFYVDPAQSWIVIGTDPNRHQIEISTEANALTIVRGGEGSIIRGIGFTQFSPVATPGLGSTVKIDTSDVSFENNTITGSAVKGIEIFGARVTIQGNLFIRNGMMGLGAWKANDLQVTGNRFIANNTEGFAVTGAVSEAAGAKITASTNIVISDNVFEGNHANGLWFDLNVNHATVSGNTFSNNKRHGLFYELSANGKIINNVSIRNGGSGIAIADANHVSIFGNKIEDNDIGLSVQDDDRQNVDQDQIAQGHSWIAENIRFSSNRMTYSDGHNAHAFIWARDFNDRRAASQMFREFSNNSFSVAPNAKVEKPFVWWSRGIQSVYPDAETLYSAQPELFPTR